jgi:quercetin dioxygenase-like cupin family protein
MSETSTRVRSENAMNVSIARADQPNMVPGRRSFFQYVDLGVEGGSNGVARAQIMIANEPMKGTTGWHYHECDLQFVYVLKGAVDLQFADGEWVRFIAGDSVMIPGGTVHQERTFEPFELMEVCVPAAMATVNCDAPEGLT